MKLTIDQREIEADEGETVIQAARRHGIEIPHFCWHDKLSVAGNCRMCLVKVNNLPKLMPACNLVVAPKMTIETNNEQVAQARRNVLQFILLNHPVDCGICCRTTSTNTASASRIRSTRNCTAASSTS